MSDPTQPQSWPQQARDDVDAIQAAAGDLEQLQGADQVPPAQQPAPAGDVPPAAPSPGAPGVSATGQVIPGYGAEQVPDPNVAAFPTPAPFADTPGPAPLPAAPSGPVSTFGVGQVVSFTYPEAGTGVAIERFGVVVGVAPAGEEGRSEAGYVVGWLNEVSHPVPGSSLAEVT